MRINKLKDDQPGKLWKQRESMVKYEWQSEYLFENNFSCADYKTRNMSIRRISHGCNLFLRNDAD